MGKTFPPPSNHCGLGIPGMTLRSRHGPAERSGLVCGSEPVALFASAAVLDYTTAERPTFPPRHPSHPCCPALIGGRM